MLSHIQARSEQIVMARSKDALCTSKTQQGDSLCTKAVSEELILSETTPVTLRDKYAIFFVFVLHFEEIGLHP